MQDPKAKKYYNLSPYNYAMNNPMIFIDPIVRIKDYRGKLLSSLQFFPKIIDFASKLGIQTFSFSFLEKGVHKKVEIKWLNQAVK